jgi:hypothetical protein
MRICDVFGTLPTPLDPPGRIGCCFSHRSPCATDSLRPFRKTATFIWELQQAVINVFVTTHAAHETTADREWIEVRLRVRDDTCRVAVCFHMDRFLYWHSAFGARPAAQIRLQPFHILLRTSARNPDRFPLARVLALRMVAFRASRRTKSRTSKERCTFL